MQREHRDKHFNPARRRRTQNRWRREIYVSGSAAKGTGDAAADLDLAVSGSPRPFSIAWARGSAI